MKKQIDILWERNYAYATSRHYSSTCAALEEIKASHMGTGAMTPQLQEYMIHGLSMAWLLMELPFSVTKEDMDLMLSASILHILVELYGTDCMECAAAGEKVQSFVRKIAEADQNPAIAVEDRLLLVVKLVERSDHIEHQCNMSPDEARRFMKDAKRIWFPACLEGKVRYPEFDAALTGILDKMRGLIQVMDILFKRYDEEEDELYEEILNLTEENARIRVTMEHRSKSV